MGDSKDGSSGAAQGALTSKPGTTAGKAGRLGRLFRRPTNGPASPAQPATGVQKVGMGNLRHMRVDDVAIPRAEIIAVPKDATLDHLVNAFRDSGFTRLPVFEETLDTPLGLIHLKDLALRYGFNGKVPEFDLASMVRPLLFAPPSMPIGVLLQKMQSDRMHMALVIDEYGGVDGLVTIEDLIEQVIGEIEDEHDEPEDLFWSREAPGVFLAMAKAPLPEFEAELGVRLSDADADDEIDTLGGLVFLLLGRVPARGEVIPHPSGAEFEIVDADPRRIKRIRVRAKARKKT